MLEQAQQKNSKLENDAKLRESQFLERVGNVQESAEQALVKIQQLSKQNRELEQQLAVLKPMQEKYLNLVTTLPATSSLEKKHVQQRNKK